MKSIRIIRNTIKAFVGVCGYCSGGQHLDTIITQHRHNIMSIGHEEWRGESPGVLGNHEDNVRIELCTGIPTIVIILSTHLIKYSWEKYILLRNRNKIKY